jgi:hypothetical protein
MSWKSIAAESLSLVAISKSTTSVWVSLSFLIQPSGLLHGLIQWNTDSELLLKIHLNRSVCGFLALHYL